MRRNFQLVSTVEIVAGDRHFDLHNCFDFVGFEYQPTEKKACLTWKRGAVEYASPTLPGQLVLTFEGVTNFAVKRRDEDMPFTEDNCVASITFLPPELADNFGAIIQGYRSHDEHLSIEFQSGSGLKIWAETATCEIGPP